MKIMLFFPGWGIPADEYPDWGQQLTCDYGFFGAAPAFSLTNPEAALATAHTSSGAILLGHSLGALLAMQAALALPDGAARGLILMAPFARFTATADGWPGQPAAVVETMIRNLAMDAAAVLRSFYRRAAAPESVSLSPPVTPHPERLIAGLRLLLTADLRREVAKLAMPVLILHGEADRIVPLAQGERLAEMLPRSKLVRLSGAGHLLPFTRAEECRKAMAEFGNGLS